MKLSPGKVGFDPTYQEIDDRLFEYQYKLMDQWRELYLQAIDPFTHAMTDPLDNTVQIICYVDTNHAGNILNR